MITNETSNRILTNSRPILILLAIMSLTLAFVMFIAGLKYLPTNESLTIQYTTLAAILGIGSMTSMGFAVAFQALNRLIQK